MAITDGFINFAQRHPDRLAVQLGSDRRCYGELLSTAQQVANGIRSRVHKAPAPPVVAILLTNQIEFLECFLGTAMAGSVAMILNPDWSPATLWQILDQWTPSLLITQASLLPLLTDRLLDHQSVDFPILVVGEDQVALPQVESYAQWRDRYASKAVLSSIAPTDPFYICFTSGTTGQPKAVIRHHQSWCNSIAASQIEFGITAADRILAPGSLVHSLFLYTAIEALVIGATLHLLPKFNPRTAIAQLHQHSITILVGVPILLGAIVKAAQSSEWKHSTVKTIISGGAKLGESLYHQLAVLFPSADCFEYYGATELSFISVWSSRERAPFHSVGRAFHGVEVSIRRETDYSEAAIEEIGWIGVKSDLLSLGYLNPIDALGYRIVQGWATVGDRGWLDKRGYLYLAGREQDLINSGGLKVYPSEVEALLEQCPEIAAAVVVGLPDGDRGDRICAVLQWADQNRLTRRELQNRLLVHLTRHKCPHRFFAIEQFPLTTSGKIARTSIRQQLLAGAPTLQIIV